jgi:hemolysin III
MDFHDPIASSSHLFTAGWAAFATAILLRMTRGHGRAGRAAVAFYGLSMVLLYVASGLFHGLRHETVESFRFFQKLDKSAIFLLILGSNVPLAVYLLRGWWRRSVLLGMSSVAAFGIFALWFLPAMPHDYLVGVYVAMGLLGVVPARQYWKAIGWPGAVWTVLFAGAYLVGALIEVLRWPVLVPGYLGAHELLHLFDTLGTLLHFGLVVKYVIRRPPLADLVAQASKPVPGLHRLGSLCHQKSVTGF